MAMNLDAVLRLIFKTEGTEAITKAQAALGGVERTAAGARKAFGNVVSSASWQAAAAAAAGIGVALGSSVVEAVKFESAMADVKKVVDGLDDARALREMESAIIDLSRELPISAEGITQIVAAAGQAGIAKGELLDFARSAAQMGIAFDITADQAGDAMAKLRTSMGLSQAEVVNLADAMNYLSNVQASSASEITDFMLRVGAFGQQVAMTEEQTAALGSAMIAAGAAPEVAATSFRNLIKEMAAGVNATEKQEESWKRLGLSATDVANRMQKDAVGTLRDVFQRLAKLPAEVQIPTIEALFGNEARALTPLIKNLNLFEESIKAVGDQSRYTGSMLREFEARSGTTANQFQLFQNNVKALQIELGRALLPALNTLAKLLLPIVSGVSQAASEFPALTAAVVGLSVAFAAIVAALPFIASALSILGSLGAMGVTIGGIFATIAGWLGVLGPAFAALGAAVQGVLAVVAGFITWPVLLVAALVAAGVAIYVFRDQIIAGLKAAGDAISSWVAALWQWGAPIRNFWISLWNGAREIAMGFFTWIGSALLQYFVQPWLNLGGVLANAARAAFSVVRPAVIEFFSWWRDTLFKLYVEPFVVAGARLAAGFVAVRDQILAAWSSFGSAFGGALTSIGAAFNQYVIQPIKTAWQALQTWMQGIVTGGAQALQRAYQAIANSVTGAFRGVVNSVGRIINSVIGMINKLIDGANAVRSAVGLSGISRISQVSIPSFAEGGFQRTPTLARVADGGEGEYMIPASKMAQASANYLSGARGDAVLSAGPSVAAAVTPTSGRTAGGPLTVNITTGPVMEFEGARYATLEDLQSAARQTATQIYATLRTPAGRRAIGVA